MKKKTALILFLSILIVIATIGIIYTVNLYNKYPIENTKNDILKHLIKWETRFTKTLDIELVSVNQLGTSDTYIALYKQYDTPSYAVMKKGRNNKLMLKYSGRGSNQVKFIDVNTNEGKYGILYGTNLENRIDTVKVEIEYVNSKPSNYVYEVPEQLHFLEVKKLTKSKGLSYTTWECYDENQKQITID